MTSLEGARVLVTGADGFIGSHLTERLVAEGCDVVAMVLYNSFGQHGWLDSGSRETRENVDIQRADIRDRSRVAELASGTDLTFHLAALIAIPYSYVAAESYVDTNIHGTLNVLEAARTGATKRVIVTSTSEVYGTPESTPISVENALRAQSPYAATKIAADQLTLSYARTFGLEVSVLRPFNTYGPRQSLRAVIPTLLAQMLAGDVVKIGSLSPRRDFCYVTDTVAGFVKMAELDQPVDVVQIGSGRAVSIAEVVEMCRKVTGYTGEVVLDYQRTRPAESEVEVLLADTQHAEELLGWIPKVTLEDGLAYTAQWLQGREHRAGVNTYHR